MEGLKFNPFNTMGYNPNDSTQTVPTVANDYWTKPQLTSTPVTWKPDRLKYYQDLVNWTVNAPEKEKEMVFNPLAFINKWDKGLFGLDDDEREEWEKLNAAKIAGKSDEWKERLWKNQMFANTFGKDAFYSFSNAEDRDYMFKDYLATNAIKNKFYGNQNLDQLLSMTPEGKIELLKSDYKSDYALQQEEEENPKKDWLDYSWKDRWNAVASQAVEQGKIGGSIGSPIGAAAGTLVGVPGMVGGALVGWAAGATSGMLSGILTGIFHPEDGVDISKAQKRIDNEQILEKITLADNERMKEDNADLINQRIDYYLDQLDSGQISKEYIDKKFDDLALNGKRKSDIDGEEYDYHGSNYYSAFKGTDEFNSFDTYEKIKYLAQSEVVGQNHGQGKALQMLETDMQNYISDHQSALDWTWGTAKGIWTGGVANLGLKFTGLGALGARLFYGNEGLNNYLQGKDASGDGTDNDPIFNPQYWEKVDRYNTFSGREQAEADENGGISKYNNVYKPGTEGRFDSWSTFNEALKMNKFFWSDALTNIGAAKALGLTTKLVAATGKTATAETINTLGSYGIVATSSLGIDAAYGMQTYNDVLDQNNAKLDEIIDIDTEKEVKRRLETPQAQEEFRSYVDGINAQRKAQAGERGSYIGVDEKEAWDAYIAHVTKQVREEQEKLHEEDRKQAELAAADAYAVDATTEALRMASTNAVFKSYLFDKGTLNAISRNNPYVNTTFRDGAYALGKNATRKRWQATLGANIFGGFHSNYYDDVTVGMAKGLGLQEYNNYLFQKYSPAAYGAVIDDYVNPLVAALAGAGEASTEGRSFLDGAIGALGTVTTAAPNIPGWFTHKTKMKELAKNIESYEKSGGKVLGAGLADNLSHYFSSPIIDAIVHAREDTRMTQAEINRINNALKEQKYPLENMTEAISTLDQKAVAREGTSAMQAEDAKDREAYTLASTLISLKNSGVVTNAQAEPDKSSWNWKKKASRAISDALNKAVGINIFEAADSPYTRAMLALDDAATIDQMPFYMDNISEEELQNNPELTKAWRQSTLIDTFLGLEENKNAIEGMSQEEQVAFAQERLKKNATSLLQVMDKMEKIQNTFQNSLGATTNPAIAEQLAYQYVLDSRFKNRSKDLEGWIQGEDFSEEDAEAWYENLKYDRNNENSVMAKYGSMEGYNRTVKEQEKRVERAQKEYDKAVKDYEQGDNPSLTFEQNVEIKAMKLALRDSAQEKLNKEKIALDNINKDRTALESAMSSYVPVVLAQDILKLHPDERLRMLDDYYRNDYSEEQQKEIDKAKNMLIKDGTPINVAMERVRDAAVLNHRIEDNMQAAKKIMKNPDLAIALQRSLNENRKKAVMDYFNDKIVREAFMDFGRDQEAALSQENVQKKAKGYSMSVLNGVRKAAIQEQDNIKRETGFSDIILENIIDGIDAELKERNERMKDTVGLSSFLNKTDNVEHTDVIEMPTIDMRTGGLTTIASETREDRPLSLNDKLLVQDALDYSADKAILVDELAERIAGKDYDAFMQYVEEKNHAKKDVSMQTTPVSSEYLGSLMNDMLKAYNVHKEKMQKMNEEKATTPNPESVVTPSVEPQTSKPESTAPASKPASETNKEAPAVDYTNMSERNQKVLDAAASLNSEILGDIQTLLEEVDATKASDKAKENIKGLIEALTTNGATTTKKLLSNMASEAMLMDTETARIATSLAKKDITKKESDKGKNNQKSGEKAAEKKYIVNKAAVGAATVKDYGKLRSINEDFYNEHPERVQEELTKEAEATAKYLNGELSDRDYLRELGYATGDKSWLDDYAKPEEIRTRALEEFRKYEPYVMKNESGSKPAPMVLASRDLDSLMDMSKTWNTYIEGHQIIPFLQGLSKLWHRDKKTREKLQRTQVYFLYDPKLASDVAREMGTENYNPNIDAPIVMVVEISDKTKELKELVKDAEHQLITVRDVGDNKTERTYQPIAIMPSGLVNTVQESADIVNTAERMGTIREKINSSGKDFTDDQPYLLRYNPSRKTAKNGTVIKTQIQTLASNMEARPEGVESTPARNVAELFEENFMSPTEALVTSKPSEKQDYLAAKKKGLSALKNNSLYKAMKKAFTDPDRLATRKKVNPNPEEKDNKEVVFYIIKGNKDKYPASIWTKPIGETMDRNAPGRSIVDNLRAIDSGNESAEEARDKATTLINSNSRFKRLFNLLSKLPHPPGLFNSEGVQSDNYTESLEGFANSVQTALDRMLNIYSPNVTVDITDGVFGKQMNIHVFSGGEELAVLGTMYNNKLSPMEFASFLKNLILDKEGNVRMNPKKKNYERVKWQFDYGDVEKLQNGTDEEKTRAQENIGDLFDDGVLEMKKSKLVYPPKNVVFQINADMRRRLYTDVSTPAENKNPDITDSKASHEDESPTGNVDANSGLRTEQKREEILKRPKVAAVLKAVQELILRSKDRNISKNDDKHYTIDGQEWARMTSVKHAMEGVGERFNPENGYALPSSLLGNSFDEFGRDAFNGVFDSMDSAQRKSEFESYDNSTPENYEEVYKALKAFEARLLGEGKVIIATGTRQEPGKITSKSLMNVTVKTNDGIETRQIRVAGTVDILVIDSDGNLEIHDFKTHSSRYPLNKEIAQNASHGYDRQLSGYAYSVQDEVNEILRGMGSNSTTQVTKIGILPASAYYPKPSGKNNDGTPIAGAQKTYRRSRQGSNQLEAKDVNTDDSHYQSFDGANFKVEKEFYLDMLPREDLDIDFSKLTAMEKASIVEAINDQAPINTAEEVTEKDVVEAQPEAVTTQDTEDDNEGTSVSSRLKAAKSKRAAFKQKKGISEDTSTNAAVTTDSAINTIDPTKGSKAEIEEKKNGCGGSKK